jgi:uncharacterized repeat protein (TIGR01451 family)
MSRKPSGRTVLSFLGDFAEWLGRPHQQARRRPAQRRLRIESLESRSLLTANPGGTIQGVAFNDLTGNGLTVDDTRLSSITINLYKDGGNGTFQGATPGSDDTLVGSVLTSALGSYAFDHLDAGTYFAQEVAPGSYLPLSTNPVTVVISAAAAKGTPGPAIDTFLTNQNVDASSLGSTTVANSITAPEAIGGHRDMFAQLTSAFGDVSLTANAFNQHLLEYNSTATGAGQRIITWDGPNSANPAVLNPTGLNHVDLTGGGLATGFYLALGADHDNGVVTMKVYKDGNNWSQASAAIPNTGGGAASQSIFIPFSSFTIGGGSGAGNFTDVGAVQLLIEGNSAVNGQISQVTTAGPTVFAANFANYQAASIGDFVFWDLNKSGVQTGSNPGASNVTVQLLQNNVAIATTTTDAQGAYHFNNLTPGVYSVKFITSNGTLFTTQDAGNNDALDSDPNPATGITSTFTLSSGQNDTTHDAGLVPIDLSITKTVNNPTATVGTNVTFVISLTNGSGYSQATGVTVGDVLPAGLTFVSATPGAGTTFNSSTGVWNVGNLASGATTSLSIIATVASGGVKTNTAIVTGADEVDVGTPHQASATVTPPGSIGDFAFWDMNKNGIQDASETAAANIGVQLLQNGAVIASTTTNAQGAYLFNNVAPGNYSLKFVSPNGSVITAQDQGNNDALDSDPDPSTGLTSTFALASGQSDMTHDVGLLPIDLSITKTVDNPTPAVGTNVTFVITLSNAAGYSQGTGVLVSDVLPAGLTLVSASPAAGTTYNTNTGVWNVGTLASGASTTLTIIATVVTGGTKTNTAIVTTADEADIGTVLQASASVTPPGSIGDKVFWDMNKNGIQDASDQAAVGVTVQLLQNSVVIATTTTNDQGAYMFSSLTPGAYSLKFITTNGTLFTTQHQGANPAIDSDPNPATGTTDVFTLASGQSDSTRDAGLLPIDLTLVKTVNNPTPTIGSNVTFVVTVGNKGGYSPATGVLVGDILPSALQLVSFIPSVGSYDPSTGVWSIGGLPSGASVTLTIVAKVTSPFPMTNTALVTFADEPDVEPYPVSSVTVTPNSPPNEPPPPPNQPPGPPLSKALFLGR